MTNVNGVYWLLYWLPKLVGRNQISRSFHYALLYGNLYDQMATGSVDKSLQTEAVAHRAKISFTKIHCPIGQSKVFAINPAKCVMNSGLIGSDWQVHAFFYQYNSIFACSHATTNHFVDNQYESVIMRTGHISLAAYMHIHGLIGAHWPVPLNSGDESDRQYERMPSSTYFPILKSIVVLLWMTSVVKWMC